MTRVTVQPDKFENPVLFGLHVLTKLRDAGVPAIGVLWPAGVESGTLSVEPPDLVDGSVTWSWAA